ncbi:hypothetical protein RhiirC2_760319 [Rhizophagus irregularis]|uniref:Uncharacterized protein n=1 Tax=Rhizophagus irregularis TaxID=588596 RepID=A0A2N1MJI1_9GLOM|nr:hypothetical protein RhiirC2_760319 [Rhizophagus irregularis]
MSRKSNVTKKQRSPSLAQEISEEFICLSEMNPEPLPGKLLLEPATVLAKKPASKWKEQDVKPLADILAGRVAIAGTGENQQGAQALGMISADLTEFALSHPKIRSIIDPIYVIVDLTTCKNAPPNINNYPPPGSPHVALVIFPGTNHVFSFNNESSAQHFVGWLQGSTPGIRVLVFHTGHAAVIY